MNMYIFYRATSRNLATAWHGSLLLPRLPALCVTSCR